MKKHLCVLGSMLALSAAPALAQLTVDFNFQNLSVVYNPGAGTLTLNDTTSSFASVETKSNGVTVDAASISNLFGPGSFELDFVGSVVNPAGPNNVSLTGSLAATDTVTTLANPSIAADFTGITSMSFVNNSLFIQGNILALGGNSSILLYPLGGPWVYQGEAFGQAAGADGVQDQISIPTPARDGYGSGVVQIIEITLTHYADGTPITATSVDELFANAPALGFSTTSAQLQLKVIPAPAAVLLGLIGLGMVGGFRRRMAS